MPELNLLLATRMSLDVSFARRKWEKRNNKPRALAVKKQMQILSRQCENDFGHDWTILQDMDEGMQERRILSPDASAQYNRLLAMIETPWKIGQEINPS